MYGDHMPPLKHSPMIVGQVLVGLPEGATDGFALGWGTVGIRDTDGLSEGARDGIKLMLGDSEGIELGGELMVGSILG